MKKYIELVYAVCLLTANLPAGFASDDDDAIHFGEISGKITNAETGAPLADVNISVVNSTFGAASSAHGFYLINNVPAGVYRLLISRIGYETEFQDNVLVKPGKIAVRDVKLTPAIVQLNEVIMSASRREQTARMTPASVSVVSSSDIEHRNVSTFDQALDDVPGISIQRTIGVSVQSLSIRGSSDVAGGGVGNRVFLAIDGRPALSSDSGGALWSLVPTNFIDRIEVVKGAFSSLYGSTAMGGVINVITKKPYARGYLKVKVNSGFYESPPKSLQYNDGVSFFNSVELNHSNSFGKFSYLLSLSRKESDGHRQRSAYEFYNLYGKLFFDLSNNRNLEVTIGGDVGRNDYPHTWFSRLRPLNVAPKNTDNEQRKRTFSTDVYYYAVPNPRVKYSSRFFFYRQLFKSVFNPDDPLRSIPGNEPFGQFIRSDSRKIGNISQLDYYLSDENYLSVGADIQRDIVDSVPDTILYGNRRVNNFAAYFQDEHEISDKLTVNVGARYDLNKLEGGKLLTQFSPKVALNFSPVESWSLRFLAGRAFRAPSIAERFFQEEIAGGTRFKPNPDLRAEKVTSLELGSRFGLGSKADLDVALFHNTYDDMIYWINISDEDGGLSSLFQVQNLNKALMQGFEASLSFYPSRNLSAKFNYTYLDSKDLSENKRFGYLAYKVRHSLNLIGSFKKSAWLATIEGRYRSKVEEVFLYPNDKPGAFFLWNSKVMRDIGPHFTVSLGVNNIFNKQYEELARYRMPGRNWMVGASYEL